MQRKLNSKKYKISNKNWGY